MSLVQGDIVALDVDAIVNAANSTLQGGGGVDGAIHRAAGPGLLFDSRQQAPCPTGEARITSGHRLAARHVIHTVGPVWQGGTHGEPELLARCYRSSLTVAAELELDSVAFPAISTGIFGYPIAAACEVAVREVAAWLDANDWPAQVLFCMYSSSSTEVMTAALAALERPDLVGDTPAS